MFSFFNKFKYFDQPLQLAVILLSVSGLAILYSTSLATEATSVFWRQAAFFLVGVAGYLFLSFFDYHTLAKANRVIYLIFLVLLVYILFFGIDIRGGRRWLSLGFVNIQLAEFVKIAVILGLARMLHLRRGQINKWTNIAWSFLYAFIPAALIIKEPDLGSALVILAVWAGILMVSPIKKRYLGVILIAGMLLAGASWQFFLKDFQKDRVKVFLNPSLDPRGRGYNVRQAIIAVGSGEILGRGLGKGLQSQHKFLPERQTDFIFASSSEEIGFVGAFALLFLFFFLFRRLVKIIRLAKDDLGMYIAAGVFFLLLCHVVINVGMNLGLMPVTGIPLPFVSAGGSSLVVTLWSLGIVQNVVMQSKALRF